MLQWKLFNAPGSNMIPVWNNVHIYGFQKDALHDTLNKIRCSHSTINFHQDISQTRNGIDKLIIEGKIHEAFILAERYPPDIRVVLKSDVTHFSGS